MQNLVTAMRNVFPDLSESALVPALRLSDCPNWDSMTAVNLLMEVETACGAKMDGYEPADTTTLGELAAAIAAAGGKP
jgi:acyl carrier protein